MTTIRFIIAAALLAAGFAANGYAHDDAPEHDGPPAVDAGGPEHGMRPGPRHGLHGLHRLHLTEAQQDKLFAIEHGAEPQRRENDKAIRKAHEALRELGRADRFDEARAGAAARDLGQAVAAEALLDARLHAQVLAVLTPEQREQLRQQRPPGAPADGAAPAHP